MEPCKQPHCIMPTLYKGVVGCGVPVWGPQVGGSVWSPLLWIHVTQGIKLAHLYGFLVYFGRGRIFVILNTSRDISDIWKILDWLGQQYHISLNADCLQINRPSSAANDIYLHSPETSASHFQFVRALSDKSFIFISSSPLWHQRCHWGSLAVQTNREIVLLFQYMKLFILCCLIVRFKFLSTYSMCIYYVSFLPQINS